MWTLFGDGVLCPITELRENLAASTTQEPPQAAATVNKENGDRRSRKLH